MMKDPPEVMRKEPHEIMDNNPPEQPPEQFFEQPTEKFDQPTSLPNSDEPFVSSFLSNVGDAHHCWLLILLKISAHGCQSFRKGIYLYMLFNCQQRV